MATPTTVREPLVATVVLNFCPGAQAFIARFLELEVSRMFRLSVTVPRSPGPVEYQIELWSTGDTPDLTAVFTDLLIASFTDGCLSHWQQAVTFHSSLPADDPVL